MSQAYRESLGKDPVIFNGVQLDEKCERCRGTGIDRVLCRGCGGSGYTLTEAGEVLRKFLSRHWDMQNAEDDT